MVEEKPERIRMRILCGTILAAVVASVALGDSLGNIGDVRLKGYLGERLDAMIERHVIGTDVDYITASFLEKTERKGWWQTEFWGKYMHSAMPYLAYTGAARLRDSVERTDGSEAERQGVRRRQGRGVLHGSARLETWRHHGN